MGDTDILLPSEIKTFCEPFSSSWPVFTPKIHPDAGRNNVRVNFRKCSCGANYESVKTTAPTGERPTMQSCLPLLRARLEAHTTGEDCDQPGGTRKSKRHRSGDSVASSSSSSSSSGSGSGSGSSVRPRGRSRAVMDTFAPALITTARVQPHRYTTAESTEESSRGAGFGCGRWW